jgi:succinate dehydrogenase / fumarate reductase cytochrome b subunit
MHTGARRICMTTSEMTTAQDVALKRGQAQPIREKPKRPLPWPIAFYRTSVGKKWAMALSGIALMGFVFVHMVGNLKMYLGESSFNHYAEFLREIGEPIFPRTVLLWGFRLGLIAAFAIHFHAAYSLTMQNRRARTTQYQSPRDYIAASFASRTMRWGGIIILLFLIWHLADLTWGWANPDFVRGEAYDNVTSSLSRVPVTILYIVANIALGFHLAHGSWSIFQSLGINNPRCNSARKAFAIAFALIVVIGNISFPLAVQLGIVG